MTKKRSVLAKRPTINDVAKAAGVSPVSVSRVINNHPSIKESTKARVEQAMRNIGYFPNAAAQAMRTNATHSIGAIITDIANPANGEILLGAEKVCNLADKFMISTSSGFDIKREIKLINLMQQRRVDGIILQTSHEESAELHDEIKRCTVPVVLVDRNLPFSIDSVLHEHYHAAREAVSLLINIGHRRIGIIAAELSTRPGHDRVVGYRDELVNANLTIDESLIRTGSHLSEHGYHETISLMSLPNPPTVIFAGGSLICMGALKALKELKLKIPEDVSLMGSDDADYTALYSPSITIINRDMEKLGKNAAELLLARIDNKLPDESRQVVLPSEVILRSSCAPPKKST